MVLIGQYEDMVSLYDGGQKCPHNGDMVSLYDGGQKFPRNGDMVSLYDGGQKCPRNRGHGFPIWWRTKMSS